ncbi:hypothetical protein [Acetobacter vaccinii]|uniref:Uncharacterized protein n=1 Tax=Acetobacter vaccinii TaxID=2592655 RepID=A0A5C1YQM0_9PROT|nr:hypothetical protein [Acetobacter vaccinii]QEO17858.1 hypothetical protein FLP30_09025 [Acetobacter vaccinii]
MVMQTVAQPVTANVIPGAGVPKLWSTVISDAEAVASVELDTLLQSTLIKQVDKQWGLFDKNNKPVLTSGRVRAIDARTAAQITDAPQENGAFMSYNKVKLPGQIMLEMLCDGTAMSYGNYGAISNLLSATGITGLSSEGQVRAEFLTQLDGLVSDLNLYAVTTPEGSYSKMNVVGYAIRRASDRGITLLWAQIMLQEVRLTARVSRASDDSTKTAAGATQQNSGNVQAQSSDVPVSHITTNGAVANKPVLLADKWTIN